MIRIFLVIMFSIFSLNALADENAKSYLTYEMQKIEQDFRMKLGISAYLLETGEAFGYNDGQRFFMASTVKVPVAVYLMYLVDQQRVALNKMVDIRPKDMAPGSGSTKFMAEEGLSMSLANMLYLMMTVSDNTCTDLLLKEIGSPKAVKNYLKQLQLNDILIERDIYQIFLDASGIKLSDRPKNIKELQAILDNVDPKQKLAANAKLFEDTKDTTTPNAMNNLAILLFSGKLLSASNTVYLTSIMNECRWCNRLKGLLPKDTEVSSKTGSWDWDKGTFSNSSEVGMITLPNNKGHIVISAYAKSDQYGVYSKNLEEAISRATKTIYDYYLFH